MAQDGYFSIYVPSEIADEVCKYFNKLVEKDSLFQPTSCDTLKTNDKTIASHACLFASVAFVEDPEDVDEDCETYCRILKKTIHHFQDTFGSFVTDWGTGIVVIRNKEQETLLRKAEDIDENEDIVIELINN